MSLVERHNNRLLRQTKVMIPHKELNPEFCKPIQGVKIGRGGRSLVPLAIALSTHNIHSVIGATLTNPVHSRVVKINYARLDLSQPIFLPEYERKYPEGWMSAARVKETHPIFYVDWKGNLVFVKNSRTEYYRYLYQKSILGKLGYHTWWLRGYLKAPPAPEPVKKWAKQKLQRALDRYHEWEAKRRRKSLRPATVPLYIRRSREVARLGIKI